MRVVNYKGPGIYALYNVRMNKVYIGKSKNIRRRMQDHVRSFEEKNAALNPMYADNVEDFAFIVLHKSSTDEFEKYGTILEQIYMNEIMQHIQLYNVSTYSEQHIYNNLLDIFKISDHTNKAFRNALGMYPCMLGSQPERRINAFINRAIDEAMERGRREKE